MRKLHLTRHTMMILSILMENSAQPIASSKIALLSGLASGTMYPILVRLEEAGWIESDEATWPLRKFYRITHLGIDGACPEALAWRPIVQAFGGVL